MYKRLLLPLLALGALACDMNEESTKNKGTNHSVFDLENTTVIAVGSCSHEYDDNQMWDEINEIQPDYWIWVGDNIYGDTHDPNILRKKYELQKNRPSYQELILNAKVYGTWDDHDYGVNDGGMHFSMKEASKAHLLNFLGYTLDHPVRTHPGMYHKEEIQVKENELPLILLDTRWFRDTLYSDTLTQQRYLPNTEGDVLGEAQWAWLEQQLIGNTAKTVFIVSSIQFVSEEHNFEKWSNFPSARKRMLDLLEKYPAQYFFLSGDRHISEISKMQTESGLELWDFTSSGLTHSWEGEDEPNRHRVSSVVHEPSYGLLTVSHDLSELKVYAIGKENKVIFQQGISLQ